MRRKFLFLSLLFCGSAVLMPSAQAQDTDPVFVTLRSEAVVDDSLVTLAHVAKLTGGTEAARRRLGNLDVAEFRLGSADMVVRSEQVRFRMLLAGLDETQFRLGGAKQTLVMESDEPASVRKILAVAQQTLGANYPGNLAHATFTPGRGVNVPSVELRRGERVHLEANIKGPVARAGIARLDVAVMVGGKVREIVPVSFEIDTVDAAGPSAEARGKSGIRPAAFTGPAVEERDFVIKAKDNVKIIAQIGAARIEALGEAQQDGRLGEIIRVRNIESNRIVHGRVEAGGLVLVDY
jgi:hypothetical protein